MFYCWSWILPFWIVFLKLDNHNRYQDDSRLNSIVEIILNRKLRSLLNCQSENCASSPIAVDRTILPIIAMPFFTSGYFMQAWATGMLCVAAVQIKPVRQQSRESEQIHASPDTLVGNNVYIFLRTNPKEKRFAITSGVSAFFRFRESINCFGKLFTTHCETAASCKPWWNDGDFSSEIISKLSGSGVFNKERLWVSESLNCKLKAARVCRGQILKLLNTSRYFTRFTEFLLTKRYRHSSDDQDRRWGTIAGSLHRMYWRQSFW